MANYSSYKKVANDRIVDGSIPSSAVASGSFSNWCVKWFYGQTNVCNPGCCCNWSVPTGTTRMTIEAWGAGGNGHTENVTVTVVVTGSVLVEVSIILKLLVQLLDANTLYVLVVHIVVVLENVQDVTVVHLM